VLALPLMFNDAILPIPATLANATAFAVEA
jgi:hypothetical protein